MRGVYLLVLVLYAVATQTQGYDLMDSLTLRALMKGHYGGQQPVDNQDGKTFTTLFQTHTVRNLHFLSKNSTLISRENCRFF